MHQDRYRSFAELAAAETEGVDYRITVRPRPRSPVAVIAPHGGGIERGTSRVAGAIAGADFNLYLFEGLKPRGNFEALHLTSRRFDEPRCLRLIRRCRVVLAVHGCNGGDECALLGGRDEALKHALAQALAAAGVPARTDGHRFPGSHAENICNRGAAGMGVQLELPDPVRGGRLEPLVSEAVRAALHVAARRQAT